MATPLLRLDYRLLLTELTRPGLVGCILTRSTSTDVRLVELDEPKLFLFPAELTLGYGQGAVAHAGKRNAIGQHTSNRCPYVCGSERRYYLAHTVRVDNFGNGLELRS